MIGKIKGKLEEVDGSVGLIETSSGISYRVFLSERMISSLVVPCDIVLYTYHHIREDVQLLFGFESNQEYKLFELLLSVDGVGPKTAFHIISTVQPGQIISAVQHNDKDFFQQIKGLGKKTALKIILELSHKFNSEFSLEPEVKLSSEDQTVVDALKSLGFQSAESLKAIKLQNPDASVEEKIKFAIKHLTQNSTR